MTLATDGPDSAARALPRPQRERWQPLRGGLLNLYRYDVQEFRYEQGRLLLRGNNGTGKSRVLALQLPFLLDGEVAPHRLEPDRDPAKRVEWNLLMGRHKDRLGYTWIEFGRTDLEGKEHYLTLGCGLSAVEGRGLVGKWFFVTPRRVGGDLFLLTPAGHPLSRERLEEVLGGEQGVFKTAAAYRKAVDGALFRLGEHRYEALVNLLIQLRQPQLSRQLDEALLSSALSEALPPLPDAVVADVADAFRSLEADRIALDAFNDASAGVESFLLEYRRYAKVAARRRAEGVRATHAAYEGTGRRLRAAESALDAATNEEAALLKRFDELASSEATARAAEAALAASPEMASVRELERVRRDAEARLRGATLAVEDLERSRAERSHAEGALRDVERRSREIVAVVGDAAGRAAAQAENAALGSQHGRAVLGLRLPDGPDEASSLEAARRAANESADERLRAAKHLGMLNEAMGDAQRALAGAKSAQEELSTQLDSAREADRAARDALGAAVATLIEAFRAWAGALRELVAVEVEQTADAIAEWASGGSSESPVVACARAAGSESERRLATRLADLAQRREGERREWVVHTEERARLVAGEHRPPPVPYTRDPSCREGRLGAPLWLLCEFRADVEQGSRAGIEAALEAAGLLDAWVTPDGKLLDAGSNDTMLGFATSPLVEGDRHLGAVLVPSVDRADARAASVGHETVVAILQRIGARADVGASWVDPDGRWKLGPLHGAWGKPAAEHVGHASRETARRRRLAELDGSIATVLSRLALLDAETLQIEERRRIARLEADAAPGDVRVRSAFAAVEARARSAEELRQRVSAAEERVLARRRDLDVASSRRDADAHDLGLSLWAATPGQLEIEIHSYLRVAAELWPAVRVQVDVRIVRLGAIAALERATAEESRRAFAFDEASRAAHEATSERDVLEASVGRGAEEILRQLDDARRQMEVLRQRRREADAEHVRLAGRLGETRASIRGLGDLLEADTLRRGTAIRSFAAFVATKLLGAAVPALVDVNSVAWSDTRAVEVARRTEDALAAVNAEDASWERTQKEIHRYVEALKDALLPHGYSPVTSIEDEVLVVEVPFQGRSCTMTELYDALADEIRSRKVLLDAREREVLENYLVGEASLQLHDLLRRGEDLVQHMNDELRQRPTSTGMMLRFVWNPVDDGPPGLLEARQRLLRAGATWSPAERQALGEFLQARIREVRAVPNEGTWQQHLAKALDYRAWHTFSVERFQDGHWKRLTRRTHGTGSGGEKAVALTVPQFAAAAAHYRTADPHAPRLILLDEAFVGIDGDMRAKCMGLLTAFDLDFVMTSEREWGCYPTVPGVAICQLATVPGVDAIGVTRWVWNGRERIRDTSIPPSLVASADSATRPVTTPAVELRDATRDDLGGVAS